MFTCLHDYHQAMLFFTIVSGIQCSLVVACEDSSDSVAKLSIIGQFKIYFQISDRGG